MKARGNIVQHRVKEANLEKYIELIFRQNKIPEADKILERFRIAPDGEEHHFTIMYCDGKGEMKIFRFQAKEVGENSVGEIMWMVT